MGTFHNLLALAVSFAIMQGCAHLTAATTSAHALKGRDVDEVTANLKSRGYSCGARGEEKVVNSKKIVGRVNCGIREKGFFCPMSYGISISFDLVTNRVTSVLQDSQANCF